MVLLTGQLVYLAQVAQLSYGGGSLAPRGHPNGVGGIGCNDGFGKGTDSGAAN